MCSSKSDPYYRVQAFLIKARTFNRKSFNEFSTKLRRFASKWETHRGLHIICLLTRIFVLFFQATGVKQLREELEKLKAKLDDLELNRKLFTFV